MPDVYLEKKESVVSKNSSHNFSFIPIATQHYIVEQRRRHEAFYFEFKKNTLLEYFLGIQFKIFHMVSAKGLHFHTNNRKDKERK